jgi:hypothetical protein
MTESEPDILRPSSELRREAESLLNAAIELGAGGVRKQLLLRSFELIQRAEMISHLLEGSTPPLPS